MSKGSPYNRITQMAKRYRVYKTVYVELQRTVEEIGDEWGLSRKDRIRLYKFLASAFVDMSRASCDVEQHKYRNRFATVNSRLVKRFLGAKISIKNLVSMDLIEPVTFRDVREFCLSNSFIFKLLEAQHRTVEEFRNSFELPVMVNFLNGKTVKCAQKKLLDHRSGIVSDASSSFQPCPVDLKRGADWVHLSWDTYCIESNFFHDKNEELKIESEEYGALHKKFLVNQRKHLRDSCCLQEIFAQAPVTTGEVAHDDQRLLYMCSAVYDIQSTGRASERYGGFQAASQILKHRLLEEVPHVYTYELINSMPYIVNQEMNNFGIECEWLENYIASPTSKEDYARGLEISVNTWEKCFTHVIMGSTPTNVVIPDSQALHDELSTDTRGFNLLMLEHQVFPLLQKLKQWRAALYKTKAREYSYVNANIRYWKNAIGNKFNRFHIDETGEKPIIVNNGDAKSSELKRMLTAFILQGREACFIQHLTELCNTHEIPVFKNEGSGLITGAIIDDDLIREAGERTGLKNPKFELKELCSVKERKAKLQDIGNWR